MKIITHKSPYGGDYQLRVEFSKYSNGQTAIKLFDIEDNFPYATATIAVDKNLLNEGEVAIKNYSENEGILESLVKSNIVEPPHNFIRSNFVRIPICKLK